MKLVLQRVTEASVSIDGRTVGVIGRGVLLLVGLAESDTRSVLESAVKKITNVRIFPDERGRFQYSLGEIQGEVLLVSQFTLFADTSKGRRPDFFGAMHPERARPLFSEFVELFRKNYPYKVECGEFGAHMKVRLENDGPVTILFDF